MFAFKSPPVTRRVSVAPVKSTVAILAFVSITSVRFNVERLAPGMETPFPRMNPPRTTYPVGMTRAVDAPPVTPPLTTPVKVVCERLVAEISTVVNIAFVNTHPDRSAPVSWTPVMSIPERSESTPRMKTYGPRMYPLRATYPVGSEAESVPVIAPEERRVNVAPVKLALVMFVPAID